MAKRKVTRRKLLPKQLKRSIKPSERIEVLNFKGNRVAFRKDRKVILKVVNKKTGKQVGFLNKIEDGKPAPRFVGRTQFQFYKLQRKKTYARSDQQVSRVTFSVKSSKRLTDQIPDKVLNEVKKRSARKGGLAFAVRIERNVKGRKEGMRGKPVHFIDSTATKDDLAKIITSELISISHERALRFSTKQFARGRNKKKTIIKSAQVELIFVDLKPKKAKKAKKKGNKRGKRK